METVITPKTTIEELLAMGKISVRAYNVCQHGEEPLRTVADIAEFYANYGNFLSLRNCGLKSSMELTDLLSQVSVSEPPKIDVQETLFDSAPAIVKQVFIDEYELLLADPNEDDGLVAAIRTIIPDYGSLYCACVQDPMSLLNHSAYKGDVMDSPRLRYMVRCAIYNLFREIVRQLDRHGYEYEELVITLRNNLSLLNNELEETYRVDFCKYGLSKPKQDYLQHLYASLLSKASVRAQSFSNTYFKQWFDVVRCIRLSMGEFQKSYGNKRKASAAFYNQVLTPFVSQFYDVTKETTEDLTVIIARKFLFLEQEQRSFVAEFYNRHKRFPMFYVANEFIKANDSRDYQILSMRYGLNQYRNNAYDLSAIAIHFNLSRERVRQLIVNLINKKLAFANEDDWGLYLNSDTHFISPLSEIYESINSEEHLSLSFEAFAILWSMAFDFELKKDCGYNYLVDSTYSDAIEYIINTLYQLKGGTYSNDTELSILTLFNDSCLIDPTMSTIIDKEILPMLHIETRNGNLFFPQNHLDIQAEVYRLLYTKGEPMHVNDILNCLCERHPDRHITLTSLKSKLYQSDTILPIGKTSMYKLSHWRTVYGGNIRSLMREIMLKQDTPISLDELTDLVTDVFENTNRNSIQSSLSSCDDFVTFENGLYGLKSKTYSQEYTEAILSRSRLGFEERFKQYQEFVEEFNFLPYNCGFEQADTLKRWQFNVYKRHIEVTDEQFNRLQAYIASKADLPSNGLEVRYYKKCQEYWDYVKTNYEMPSEDSNPVLYSWFNKNLSLYVSYNDNRRRFFKNLLNKLIDYGFVTS